MVGIKWEKVKLRHYSLKLSKCRNRYGYYRFKHRPKREMRQPPEAGTLAFTGQGQQLLRDTNACHL